MKHCVSNVSHSEVLSGNCERISGYVCTRSNNYIALAMFHTPKCCPEIVKEFPDMFARGVIITLR